MRCKGAQEEKHIDNIQTWPQRDTERGRKSKYNKERIGDIKKNQKETKKSLMLRYNAKKYQSDPLKKTPDLDNAKAEI